MAALSRSLRRVMAIRDAEQGFTGSLNAGADEIRMTWLNRATAPAKCRVCLKPVRGIDGMAVPTVCTRCGGRKKQARLERDDRRALEASERERRQRDAEVQEALDAAERERKEAQARQAEAMSTRTTTPEAAMSNEGEGAAAPAGPRLCSKNCGNSLRGNNKSGICTPCQVVPAEPRFCSRNCGTRLGGNSKSGICTPCQGSSRPGRSAMAKTPSDASEAETKFRSLATALGKDPDKLVEEFMARWVSKVRAPSDEV